MAVYGAGQHAHRQIVYACGEPYARTAACHFAGALGAGLTLPAVHAPTPKQIHGMRHGCAWLHRTTDIGIPGRGNFVILLPGQAARHETAKHAAPWV